MRRLDSALRACYNYPVQAVSVAGTVADVKPPQQSLVFVRVPLRLWHHIALREPACLNNLHRIMEGDP